MATKATAPRKLSPVVKTGSVLGANPLDRVHVFIDAMNLIGMLRSVNMKIDFKNFAAFLPKDLRLIRTSYYVMMRDNMPDSALRVIDLIEYAGFDVYRKWGKEFEEGDGHFSFKGSIIPEMTVGMIDAADNGADHIILVSGDGELTAAVEAVKQRECRVTMLAIEDTMADDLRRACDLFVPLERLYDAEVEGRSVMYPA